MFAFCGTFFVYLVCYCIYFLTIETSFLIIEVCERPLMDVDIFVYIYIFFYCTFTLFFDLFSLLLVFNCHLRFF